jgi:hypothetical protein
VRLVTGYRDLIEESEVVMRTSRALAALALAGLVCLAPRLAEAWCLVKYPSAPKFGSWETVPIKYRISENLKDAAILGAIDKAFQTWGTIPCSKLTFAKDATFTFAAIPFKQATGAIFIYWITDAKDWPAGVDQLNYIYRYGGYDMKGNTTSSSIAINAFKYTWKATGASASEFDVQNLLTHFLGFSIGLEKSKIPSAVMGQSPGFGLTPDLRTLTQDDKDGTVYLYPGTGAGCTVPTAPGADNCGGAAPPPPGDGVKKDAGTTPTGDGQTKTDKPSTPAGDGTLKPDSPPISAGDGVPPTTYEASTPSGKCTSNTQCAEGEICSIDGSCVKTGGDDGCGGCEVASYRQTPALALLLLGLGLLLGFRRRR